ncbi:MAG: phage antirepressor N-terminal domain-containing protein [Acidobacteriota bacterium]|nr:phage antirepressor N-terminal domain-containing protein [Acidobacteriota bacterium]
MTDMKDWLQRNLETFCYPGDDKPFLNARGLITALGLDWETERAVFQKDDHWDYREEKAALDGKLQDVAGLPAEKLFVYLKLIDVAQVRPEIRDILADYQETSRQMTRQAFLNSDLLAAAKAKENPSPLERKLIEAAEMLERDQMT